MNVFYLFNTPCAFHGEMDMGTSFEYFKVFYYVAKYRSITTAAKELALTQPSVTRSIQNLEGQLGCRLFRRSKKGVSLTSEGQMIYQRIATACELLFSAEEELEQMKYASTGIVRIGTDDLDIRRDYLLELAERFREQCPNVKLRIVQKDGAELTEALEAGVLDCCILADASPAQATAFAPSLNSELLEEYSDVVIVGQKYAELAQRPITLAELNAYPLIMWIPDTATRQFFEELYRQQGLVMSPAVEMANIELQIRMTERGFGYSFVPLHCVAEQLARGTLFALRLDGCSLQRRLLLLTSKSRPLSFTAERFLRLLKREELWTPF